MGDSGIYLRGIDWHGECDKQSGLFVRRAQLFCGREFPSTLNLRVVSDMHVQYECWYLRRDKYTIYTVLNRVP